MSELFDEKEDRVLVGEDEVVDDEDEPIDVDTDVELIAKDNKTIAIDARRRLESLLEEKRLRNELEDFLDF